MDARHAKRVHRSARYWRLAAKAWRRSGLSQVAFCSREGIKLRTFTDRLWRMRRDAGAVGAPADVAVVQRPAPTFVPVKVVRPASPVDGASPQSSRTAPTLELVLQSGHRIVVRGDFEVSVLRKLVLAMEGLGC